MLIEANNYVLYSMNELLINTKCDFNNNINALIREKICNLKQVFSKMFISLLIAACFY